MGALLAGSVMIPMYNVNAAETPTITYQAHVEGKLGDTVGNYGWLKEVSTSDKDAFAGTQKEARRMEALKIKLEGLDDVTLRYTVHIEDYGNRDFTSKDEVIGTTGEAKRLEGITVYADGLEKTDYALQYRVHIENEGTSEWVNAGEFAGSQGKAQRLEAIQFRLLSKSEMELQQAKDDAIAILKDEFKSSNYTINAKKYSEQMELAVGKINDVTDIANITAALDDARALFDEAVIKNDEKELKNLSSTVATEVSKFTTAMTSALSPTERAAAPEIAEALDIVLGQEVVKISNSKTASEAASNALLANKKAYRAAKEAANNAIKELYNKGVDDSGTKKYLKSTIKSTYETNTTSLTEDIATGVSKIIDEFVIAKGSDYTANYDTLANIKGTTPSADGTTTLATGAKKDVYDELKKAGTTYMTETKLVNAATKAYSEIDRATTREGVETAIKNAKANLLQAAKEVIGDKLDELYNEGKPYAVGNNIFVWNSSNYNYYKTALDSENTIEGVISQYPTTINSNGVDGFTDLTSSITTAKADIATAISKCRSGNARVKTIENEYSDEIDQKNTAESINQYRNSVISELTNIERNYYKNTIKVGTFKINDNTYTVKSGDDYNSTMTIINNPNSTITQMYNAVNSLLGIA